MLDRTTLLTLTAAGLCLGAPTTRTLAAPPTPGVVISSLTTALTADADDEKKDHPKLHEDEDGESKDHDERDEKEEGERQERKIEQKVPLSMVPAAVLDAVKKELPDGKVTESELVAGHRKIMYSFDVKSGDMAYEVKITVDGKFFSKKVDDDDDDKAEADEKPEKR